MIPRLLGSLVNRVDDAGAAAAGLDTLALAVVGVVILQSVFTFGAQWTSTHFGQDLLASAREHVVSTILRLPVGRVEGASTGDLVTRVTRDVGTMARSVQWGVPRLLISLMTVLLSIVAMMLNSLVLALPALVVFALCTPAVRTYLRRAPKAYITEGATYSRINTTLTETVEGSRTVEALGLSQARVQAGSDDIAVSAQAERYGMTLRNVLFAALNGAFQVPQVVTLVAGAYGYSQGWVDLGQITAALLYVVALAEPLDAVIGEVDRLQVGAASTSRLLGIAEVPPDREPGDRLPDGVELVADDLRFAYREGHDVLHGVDLRLRTGERLAVVGPSGSGKSTLGRLLSGINRPRTGSARVGGVDLVDLPLEVLRTEVALVTQEHHVFIGTVRDNVVLAREDSSDDAVREALAAVGGLAWVERLPEGLDTDDRLRPLLPHARPGAAGRAGPPDHRRPPHARARRGDVAHRPAHRAHARGVDEQPPRGPHRRGDRPPAPHRPRRRPHRGGPGRPHRRAREPRGAARPRRGVRRPLARLDVLSRPGSGAGSLRSHRISGDRRASRYRSLPRST